MGALGIQEQVDLLMQGTEYGDEILKQAMAAELRQRLQLAQAEGRPLRVYCGFDPRTSDLHLGHTVPMRKLRQFQELGHEVVFLIGRFTSLIGDPSDKDKLRPQLTPEETARNAETYARQAFKILDPQATRIEYNDTWLSKLDFAGLIHLASNFTLQQFLTRENFRKRWESGDPIYLHETFYALMQGYDAYSLRADVQVGGTDQLFNIVTAARKVMEFMGAKPNVGIILGILPGTDGVVKMSKSLGNHIPLNTSAEDMYGKVMSIPDAAMGSYARLVTRWGPAEIAEAERDLSGGRLHPRDLKMRLAREIVAIYYGEAEAAPAEAGFRRVFQEQQVPEVMAEFRLRPGLALVDLLVEAGVASTRSDARRLIEQRGVRLDDQLLEDSKAVLEVPRPAVLKVGKRRFLRLLPPA
ncbi:MAG: tyrosine--tRNA ligase [Anaerolineales bacterium]|nr:tyrosine--tRNA ligase [Anaerolineales bacterium]